MKLTKYLAALALACSTVAFAGTAVDTSNLTEAQVTELKIKALQMQSEKNQGPATDKVVAVSAAARSEAEQWASFGKNLGTALVSTARELGVAVTEFSQTDVGKLTTFIIVYKLIGSELLSFAVGFILLIGLPALIIAARQYMTVVSAKYEYIDQKVLFFTYKRRVLTEVKKMDGDNAVYIFFWTVVATLISVVIAVVIML